LQVVQTETVYEQEYLAGNVSNGGLQGMPFDFESTTMAAQRHGNRQRIVRLHQIVADDTV